MNNGDALHFIASSGGAFSFSQQLYCNFRGPPAIGFISGQLYFGIR